MEAVVGYILYGVSVLCVGGAALLLRRRKKAYDTPLAILLFMGAVLAYSLGKIISG